MNKESLHADSPEDKGCRLSLLPSDAGPSNFLSTSLKSYLFLVAGKEEWREVGMFEV